MPLDRDYVFGRDPRQDPAVVRGAASPIQVEDGEQLISRVHAYVSVAGGQVTVRDAGSANGTYVAAPGDPGWHRIGPDPVPLPVGHSLRLGLRVYTHLPRRGRPRLRITSSGRPSPPASHPPGSWPAPRVESAGHA